MITVRALYRGNEYARTLRLTKALDGRQGEPGMQGEAAAKYLGKAFTKTTTNIVYIQYTDTYSANVNAKIGDYFLFTGASEAGSSPYKKNSLLQLTESGWVRLDPLSSANTSAYTAAMKDFLESGSENAFLFAFIGKLFTKHIVMAAPGIIESDGFAGAGGDVPGYRFTAANGLLEAIEAVFKNITILGNSHFEGDIISGQLISSNTQVGTVVPSVTFFNRVHTILDIWNYYGCTGLTVKPIYSGSYNGRGGLYQLQLSREWVPANNQNELRYLYTLQMSFAGDPVPIKRQYTPVGTTNFDMSLGGDLVIDGGTVGSTFKLMNVPNNSTGLPSGCVYRDSGNVLRIVP